MKSYLFAALAAAAFAYCPSLAAPLPPAPKYRFEVAGFHQGADYGLVTGFNNFGQAVYIRHSFGTTSYWWDGAQEIQLLPGDSFSQSVALDLDDNGVAVGERVIGGTRLLAMIWEQGVPRDLGTLGGVESVASAINDNGVVVGWSQVSSGTKHLYSWNGAFTDHGPLPPSATCCHDIEAVNNLGQVVGHDSGSLLQGWFFDGARFVNLPDLAGGFDSTPRDVNDAGLVVGSSNPRQRDTRPVTWHNAQVQALPLPPGAVGGEARALNEQGEIVGAVAIPDPNVGFLPHATLWKDGQAILLRDVVENLGDWHLRNPEHINDRGQILVLAHSNTYSWARLILTPVPEPTTIALAVIGLLGMSNAGRRCRSA